MRHYSLVFTIVLLVFFNPLDSRAGEDFASELQKPIEGPFSKPLDELRDQFDESVWKKILSGMDKSGALKLRCFTNKEKASAIGIEQLMEINAPFDVVKKVLDDVDAYASLFYGFKKIASLTKQGNVWLTNWDQDMPFPFPSVKYHLRYLLESKSNTQIYRYQLTWSESVRYSDGLIAIVSAPENPKKTIYYEIDFWNVDFILSSMAPTRMIQEESVKGVFISDHAVQIRAEKPKLSAKLAKSKAESDYHAEIAKKCLDNETAFRAFWK